MSRKAFKSDPLPFTLPYTKYVEGERDQLPVEDIVKEPTDIRKVVEFAGSDDPKAKVDLSGRGDYFNFIPVKEFIVEVDSAHVIGTGAVRPYHTDRMLIPMHWKFRGTMAMKDDLAIMDIMAGNNWNRPLYYAVTVPGSTYIGLEDFFILEGMAFHVSPVRIDKPAQGETGMVDTHEMYDKMMNKFRWGNAGKEGVYLDENNRRLFDVFRRQFGRLAKALALEGDTARAAAAAERGISIVPEEKIPFDYFSIDLGEALAMAGRKNEAEKFLTTITDNALASLNFIAGLPDDKTYGLEYNIGVPHQALYEVYKLSGRYGMTALAGRAAEEINRFYGEMPVQ
jgi:hypothetical protein